MPAKSDSSKKSSKKKTIFIIIGCIIGLMLLALAVMFLVRYYAKTKEQKAQSDAAALNAGGLAASAKSDDAAFWANPTQVSAYIADACGRGRNYMPTSKSECQLIPLGAETISETEWLKRLTNRASKGEFGFPADAISRRANAAALTALQKAATLKYTEKKYDGKPDHEDIEAAAAGAAAAWAKYYTTSCKVPNFSSDFDKIVYINKTFNNSSSSEFAHAVDQVIDDSSKEDCKKVIGLFREAFSAEFTAANCAIDNKDRFDPTLEGLYVVYPMTEACQKIKDRETSACVENVQKLVDSGTITTLQGLNDAALKSKDK